MTTKHRLIREVQNSARSFAQAEELYEVLHNALEQHPNNFYIAQALEKAEELCAEMERDADCQMENALAAGLTTDDILN